MESMNSLVEFIGKAAGPGIAIYSAKLENSGDGYHITVEIDGLESPTGAVTLEDCEVFSQSLTKIIDEAVESKTLVENGLPPDVTVDNYSMEVGSAGAERLLRLPGDLIRFQGQPVRLTCDLDGKKETFLAIFLKAESDRLVFRPFVPRFRRKKKKGAAAFPAGRKASPEDAKGVLRDAYWLKESEIARANLYLDF